MRIKSLLGAVVLAGFAGLTGCATEVDTSSERVNSEEAAGVDEAEATAVTYKQTGKLITASCGGCHSNLKTLAGVKAKRTAMIARISAGTMPPSNPTFKTTATGKTILSWLQTGTDAR
jgi:cytochrome c5